jgi:hypothetical protein
VKKRNVVLDRATLFWVCGLFAAARDFAGAAEADRGRLERLPSARVAFVENRGQLPDRVAFSAPTFFGSVLVTRNGSLEYVLREDQPANSTLSETLVAGKPRPAGGPALSTVVSYFYGNDPRRWQRDLPTYEEVRLGEAWPGVSVSLRAHARNVEKIFTLLPGAGAEAIWLRVDGARPLQIASDGTLTAGTGNSQVRFAAPLAYQERDGVRHPIPVAYVLRGSTYGFRVGAYDRTLPLVVDPVLQSTYIGGADPDSVNAIAIDPKSGDVLVAGHTYSKSFPGTEGSSAGGVDGFVARFDASLTTLKHATYLGGRGKDQIFGIAVHPVSGEVFVVGFTSSPDFPGTSGGGAQGTGGFVARLDPGLTLLRAVYVGGAQILGIAVHPSNGDVYVAGQAGSIELRTIGGAQPAPAGDLDGFIARFDPTLMTLVQATYLGGTGPDLLRAIAIHPSTGEIYVGGQTHSVDFPGVSEGAQPEPWNGFLARLDPTLTRLVQSTYLGGENRDGDDIRALAIDPTSGDVFVTGWTGQPDFPKTTGGAQPAWGGNVDGFVARLSADLKNLRQATYLGGSGDDFCYGITIDPSRGDVYVTGETFSTDLPATAGGAQPVYGGRGDAFVARLDPTLTKLLQSTYLGASKSDTSNAITINSQGDEVLIGGMTSSPDLPGMSGGAQPKYAGGSPFFGGDGFVLRFSANLGEVGTPPASSSIRRR